MKEEERYLHDIENLYLSITFTMNVLENYNIKKYESIMKISKALKIDLESWPWLPETSFC